MFIFSCPAFVRRNLRACIITSRVPTFFWGFCKHLVCITVFFLGILTGILGTVTPKREREREFSGRSCVLTTRIQQALVSVQPKW